MLFFTDCNNKKLNTIGDFDIELIIGKWRMVEYGGGSVNALDTISFYENGKMDYPFETGEFTYRFIASDSLAIYNLWLSIIVALESSIIRYSNYPMTAL